MFMQITSAATTVLCATLPVLTPSERAVDASILALVPENSFALAYCEDFAALRSRAERNDWYQMLSSELGDPLLTELAREFSAETDTDFLELLAVGKELRGESAMFVTSSVAGFVTTPPPNRAALVESMRAWLPETAPEALGRTLELGDARVEMVAWRSDREYVWSARKGHFAAFVDHPEVLGLFSGDDAATLATTIEACLAGLGTERRAPVVTGYEEAQSGKPRCGGIEIFADLTPFVPEYERNLARDWAGVIPDPQGMLGIEDDFWLLVATDVHPGTRVDSSAWLNIPQDSLAASLADTFEPLPADLPAQLPGRLAQLHAGRWNLKLFYGRLRAALEETHGEDSLETFDSLLGAESDDDGTDQLGELLSQLDGTFAFFQLLGGGDTSFQEEKFGALVSLVDGPAFRLAFDRLVGDGALESFLPSDTLEETQVYISGDEPSDFGVAFLPHKLLLGFRDPLARALRASRGVPGASMLDGSELQAAYDQNLGCCWVTLIDLSTLEAAATETMGGAYRLPAAEGEEVGRSPFESLLVYTTRRTEEGFRMEVHVQ